jgi:arginine decarboxylase
LVQRFPARYRNLTLKELSDEMHKAMIDLDLAGLVNAACDEDFDPVLTPAQTYQKLVRHETERIRFREMAGRIAAVMLVPYPPGIPMSMPGERLGGPDSPVIKLILAMEQFGKFFPGFEREVHGIEVDGEGNYWMRAVIEEPEKKRNKSKRRRPAVEPPINAPRLPSRPVRHSTE